jgi:ABC-type amino acid transport system permease subunit
LPEIRTGHFVADVAEWYWGIGRWLSLLLDTVLMAFMGTLFGTAGAFLMCFPASRNLTPHGGVYVICRRLLDIARTVPELVFALIFVYAFGLGPLPGVLAIGVHSMGALGKLFSEVSENIAPGPADGVRAAGGNWFQLVRFAVVPQVLPNFASYTLLRFEISVRASSQRFSIGLSAITSMRKPALSILTGDRRKRFRDCLPEALQRPCRLRSQDRLDFGPAFLDRGEIRRVGGQVEESSPHGFNRLAYPCYLVGFEVIEHYHLPAMQLGHQHLLDKGQKGSSVHKAFYHHGRHHPYQAQRSDHRDMPPTLHRLSTGGTLPTRGTAIVPGHGLVAAGFVDKEQS